MTPLEMEVTLEADKSEHPCKQLLPSTVLNIQFS